MEYSKRRRKQVLSHRTTDLSTGEVLQETHLVSGRKMNYIMIHRTAIDLIEHLSPVACKMMQVVAVRYLEMNTNRITCRKAMVQRSMKISRNTAWRYWRELEIAGIIVKDVDGERYMSQFVVSFGTIPKNQES